ncbi:MAG: hypothetical protein JJU00_11225 [Opitutales bacterium]|nr:hypothetical protein [Opitutales bacterium]
MIRVIAFVIVAAAAPLLEADDLLRLEAAAVRSGSVDAVLEEALPAAVAALTSGDADEDVRRAAVRILDHAGVRAASHVPQLLERLPAIPPETRWRIGRVFVDVMNADPGLTEAFAAMALHHGDAELRLFAVRMLSAAGNVDESVVDLFVKAAADDASAVRRAALRALEEHAAADTCAITLFISKLDDADENLRLIASRGLGRAGSGAERAVPHLLAALTAEGELSHIRAEMWRSLLRIAPEDPRIAGPKAHRGHRADDDEFIPGMRQRLGAALQSTAGSGSYESAGMGGSQFFSTRGWRGGEVMIPAFPEARGFGMWTPGGRGGDIYRVTTLEDGGPGSLRHAIESAGGARIILFEVSGTIHLQRRLDITSPYLTIAGQSAPGDGITLAGARTEVGANDVILRNLRFRPGSGSATTSDKGLNVREAENIIVDRVSASWAMEEVLSVVESGRVTVQRSFITHPLVAPARRPAGRGFGSLVRGAGPGRQDYAQGSNYSFLNNLWAHCRSRAPRPGNYVHRDIDPVGPLFDFRNNLVYNWGGNRAGDNYDNESVSRYNFIANYYKPGPDSSGLAAFNNDAPHARAYVAGNVMAGEKPVDQWSLVLNYAEAENRRDNPFYAGIVDTKTAEEAYEYVLANAGTQPRDAYDRAVVDEVRSGTGTLIDEDHEVGGLPELRPALAPVDSSGNGIPDWWQIRFGISPEGDLNPSGDMNGTGYTDIEEYLNGTDMEVFVAYRRDRQ